MSVNFPIIDIRDINKIKKNIYKYKAKKVKNYFEYSSLNNKKYLNINDLKSLLKKASLGLFQKSDIKFSKSCPLSGKNAPDIDYKNINIDIYCPAL